MRTCPLPFAGPTNNPGPAMISVTYGLLLKLLSPMRLVIEKTPPAA